MTKRELRNLIINRFQQLELISQNEEEFEEKDGKKGVQYRIDTTLDEINHFKKLLKKLEEDEN